jgi:hypothetical protein
LLNKTSFPFLSSFLDTPNTLRCSAAWAFKNVWSKVIKARTVESAEEGREVGETGEKQGGCEPKVPRSTPVKNY